MKKVLIFIILVVSAVQAADAARFSTKRLETLSNYLALQQLDTLREGINENYSYKRHPLVIHVNQWKEIDHIGLKLIPNIIRKNNPFLYNFLERNLLERNIVPTDSEIGFRLMWDKFHFSIGSASTALRIDTTAEFSEERVDFRVYKAGWSINGKKVLEISFTMDFQMLTGCNLIELEDNFAKDLLRYTAPVQESQAPDFTTSDSVYTEKGSTFLIPEIRNDLYYQKSNGSWNLLFSPKSPSKSIANMMLAPKYETQIPLNLKMFKYGFKTDSIKTTYYTWLSMCLEEGCDVFFGMKGKEGDVYTGTVFILNHYGGYMHLLSVWIPAAALTEPEKTPITGRMHAFIPLHNVNREMLETTGYKEINPLKQ